MQVDSGFRISNDDEWNGKQDSREKSHIYLYFAFCMKQFLNNCNNKAPKRYLHSFEFAWKL